MNKGEKTSARISPCGKFRYCLYREGLQELPVARTLVFVMLNPSTADAVQDDPTIRRCKTFAISHGYSAIAVVNLFAYRATDPTELRQAGYPIGPDNDDYLGVMPLMYCDFVCAWGANAPTDRAVRVARQIQRDGGRLWCLGTTRAGHPRHPLYVPGDTRLERWSPDMLVGENNRLTA